MFTVFTLVQYLSHIALFPTNTEIPQVKKKINITNFAKDLGYYAKQKLSTQSANVMGEGVHILLHFLNLSLKYRMLA